MAAGKTTVGRQLARCVQAPFVDLDASIAHRHSGTVEEIFRRDGEEAFRELESSELAHVVEIEPVVVALGGGTLERRRNRSMIRSAGVLVWLDTPRSTILSRLERVDMARPLGVDGDRVVQLLDQRLSTYAQCDLRLRPREGETPPEIAARIAVLITR
jgi:shikimate kinase